MFRLTITSTCNNKLIEQIQKEVYNKPEAEGTYELYDQLYVNRYCNSYSKSRIYYVAYTLAKHGIDFKITEVDD